MLEQSKMATQKRLFSNANNVYDEKRFESTGALLVNMKYFIGFWQWYVNLKLLFINKLFITVENCLQKTILFIVVV